MLSSTNKITEQGFTRSPQKKSVYKPIVGFGSPDTRLLNRSLHKVRPCTPFPSDRKTAIEGVFTLVKGAGWELPMGVNGKPVNLADPRIVWVGHDAPSRTIITKASSQNCVSPDVLPTVYEGQAETGSTKGSTLHRVSSTEALHTVNGIITPNRRRSCSKNYF